MKKKVVWLPYDMDTALGINNEGELVFDYNLEDTDHQQGGANIFNGQDSVIWNNIRDAFPDLIQSMYQTLRSNSTDTSGLSYKAVEKMFEDHQSKWSEAIFNEDAWFKYIIPYVTQGANYLGMLLGSKAEQRKWWLYNRFRYMDSKYNAGDALIDYITIRPYAAANISITPYADIYATVKWDDTITSKRAPRGNAVTLVCPYSSMNDNVVTIYSAVQLASIGDISALKPGLVNIENAINLQQLKVGDSSSNYNNTNLRSLTLGNNKLLKILDARNSSGLGDTTLEGHTQTVVDISGCTGIEEVYFDGTKVTGVTLPDGGVLRILHLPSTITNLTIRNQPNITDLTANVSHVTTLRIENCPTVNVRSLLTSLPANARVRFVGVAWEAVDSTEIETLLDLLDTMRGLDINGNNLEDAYVEGTLHTTALTGEQIASYKERYPYLKVTADSVVSYLTLKTWDDSSTIKTIECRNGVPQESIPTGPSRTATAQYNYTFVGWNTYQDAETNDPDAVRNVLEDRTVYAAYSRTVRTYTITWVNNGATIETDTNVPYGATPQYNGATPTKDGQTSTGWNPAPTTVTGNATYTATYLPSYSVKFYNGSTLLYTDTVIQGGTATYSGATPVNSEDSSLAFLGWGSSSSSTSADAVLSNITANKSVYAVFESGAPTATTADGAYGVEWDYSQSSPQLTRKGLAASFSDPVPATDTTTSGSSPFDTIQPWAGMKEVNILSDGTVIEKSDSRFSYTDNDVMVWIPEFYYTAYKDTTNQKWLWAISPTAKEGFKKHPGSGRYVSKYHTSGDINAVYSKSGVTPLTKKEPIDFMNYSRRKGSGWYSIDIQTWSALQLLYLVEFGTFDSQSVLGFGFSTTGMVAEGSTNASTYHTIKSDTDEYGNQYRWIEKPIGNARTIIEGIISSSRIALVSLDNSNNVTNSSFAKFKNTHISSPSNGYITGFGYSQDAPFAFIPDSASESGGSDATYTCDYTTVDNATEFVCVGGLNYMNKDYGFFCYRANIQNYNGADRQNGSRLIYIPQ